MRLVPWLVVVGLVGVVGCGTRQSKGTVGPAEKAVEDPWPAAVAGLRKETTPGGIGRVLGELTAATSAEPKYAADSLSPAAEATLKDIGRLTEDDLKTLRPAGFSPLDPHHLAECFYLRDAVRTLDLDGLPPDVQARRAFDWVCRQVVLAPWVGPGRTASEVLFFPPAPPSYVLRRGSGSGLERAFVVLAVCRQLGLDAVLVGSPDAADKSWKDDPAPQPNQPPRGPFWAVGVRAGGDVLLFDPWRGVPFAGPGGAGVLTLAQAVANPEAAKDAGQPADRVKASVPFLSLPIPGLAPRLKRLEAELKADARLSVDLPATVKGFADATKVAPKVWNPPADPFAYPRGLAGFIPPAEGGMSPLPELPTAFRESQIPPTGLFAAVPGLVGDPNDPADLGSPEAVDRLNSVYRGLIRGQFLTDPTPRERVQRGQPDAVRQLVAVRDECQKAQERLRTDRDRDKMIREWVAASRERSRKIAAARDRNPTALAAAEGEFQQFFKDTLRAVSALADLAVADTGIGEATYLIALTKHEQAVREQGRADRQPAAAGRRAADAWAEARDWWGRYESLAGGHDKVFPGRAAQAKRLAGEAAGLGS